MQSAGERSRMALTDQQGAELKRLGPRIVQMRLDATGNDPGALVQGTKDMDRRGVEDWLAAQGADEAKQRADTLRWAKIAGWAALAAVGLTIVVPLLQWLLGK